MSSTQPVRGVGRRGGPGASPPPVRVRIVCALPLEARPIAARLNLRAHASDPPPPFALFAGDGVELVVSGVGAARAAAACGYLAGRAVGTLAAEIQDPGLAASAWLNVGLAGHRSLPVGEVRIAHRVSGGSRSWYPGVLADPPCAGAAVRTVHGVEREYPGDELYDMEAAAFCEAATRFAPVDLVQVVKVVSDNRATRAERIPAAELDRCAAGAARVAAEVARRLACLAEERGRRLALPHWVTEVTARWPFSATRRRQLQRLARRWRALRGDASPEALLHGAASAPVILERLAHHLDDTPPRIAP